MAISADGIIEATFDPAWAAVDVVIDGAMWPSAVDTITIARTVAGGSAVILRGVDALPVVGGYWVGTDHEGDLNSSITYRVDGYLGAAFVASATVSAPTSGAASGLWLKVAGRPDLTVRCDVESIGRATSATIGGVYQIAGGGGVISQTAQWSGVTPDSVPASVRVDPTIELSRLRSLMSTSRVLLAQGIGASDIDHGWYYVDSVTRTNPGDYDEYPYRVVGMSLTRTGIPAGDGTGIAGLTWATVFDTYATWTALATARATWFDVLKDS